MKCVNAEVVKLQLELDLDMVVEEQPDIYITAALSAGMRSENGPPGCVHGRVDARFRNRDSSNGIRRANLVLAEGVLSQTNTNFRSSSREESWVEGYDHWLWFWSFYAALVGWQLPKVAEVEAIGTHAPTASQHTYGGSASNSN